MAAKITWSRAGTQQLLASNGVGYQLPNQLYSPNAGYVTHPLERIGAAPPQWYNQPSAPNLSAQGSIYPTPNPSRPGSVKTYSVTH